MTPTAQWHQSPGEAETFSNLALQLCDNQLADRLGFISKPPLLGCGHQGCTYRLGKSKVLKITPVEAEAQFHLLLLAMQKGGVSVPEMLPYVYDAFSLKKCGPALGPTSSYYGFVREDLQDLDFDVIMREDPDYARTTAALVTLLSSLIMFPNSVSIGGLSRLRQFTTDAPLAEAIDAAGQFVYWLYLYNFVIADGKEDNWGLRRANGKFQLVMRDLGIFGRDPNRDPAQQVALPKLDTLQGIPAGGRKWPKVKLSDWTRPERWQKLYSGAPTVLRSRPPRFWSR